jgi:hypothetical protein
LSIGHADDPPYGGEEIQKRGKVTGRRMLSIEQTNFEVRSIACIGEATERK